MRSSSIVHLLAGLGEDGGDALLAEAEGGANSSMAIVALSRADSIPVRFERQLFLLLQRLTGKACSPEQLVGSLLKALLKVENSSEEVLAYVQRVLNGVELRCCSETTRLRVALGALAGVAAQRRPAFELLKANFALADRLPGGQFEINSELLRASPGEGGRLRNEIASVFEAERRLAARVEQVRAAKTICLSADGAIVEPGQAKPIGRHSSGEEIAEHFSRVGAELEGKSIDPSKAELELLIGSELSVFANTLIRDRERILSLRNANCESVLHAAILRGNTEQLRTILNVKPELDLRDRNGRTALMHAGMHGHVEVVCELLRRGADVTARNGDGDDAMALAKQYSRWDVVSVLAELVQQQQQQQQQQP